MSDCGGDDCGGGDSGGGDCGGGDSGGGDCGGDDVQMTTFDSDYPAETSYSSPDPPAECTEMTYFESSAPADELSYLDEKNGTSETVEEMNISRVDVFLDDTESYTPSRAYYTSSRTCYTPSRTNYTPSRTRYTHTSNNYRPSRGATDNDSEDCCESTLNGSIGKLALLIAAVLVGLLVIVLILNKR